MSAPALHRLSTATRIASFSSLGPGSLSAALLAVSGKVDPVVVVIRDPRSFPALDSALEGAVLAGGGIVLDRVVPNPRVEDIMEMSRLAAPFRPDIVLGVGGGSALDSAKAVAFMARNQGDLEEYLGPGATRKPEAKGAPLVLVPTTTGTGAEVTKFGVYTARSGRKFSLGTPFLQADAALLVADAVADIPPALLASTAYDAVTHALETLWNRNATPLSDAVAAEALVCLLENAEIAYCSRLGGRSDGVRDLLESACAAGVAFNMTGTAAIHALSFVLSEEWHVPHGAACAFFTDAVYAVNSIAAPTKAKLAGVARRLSFAPAFAGEGDAIAWLGDYLAGLRGRFGLPGRFSEIGEFPGATLDVAALFDRAQDDFKMKNNAVALGPEAVRDIVERKLR